MANFETPLAYGENPKKLPKELNAVAENDKKGDFKQERMFCRVAKIPIANTFGELAEMDFADYGDCAAFLRIRDAFPRFPAIVLRWLKRKKNKRQKWFGKKATRNRSATFGAPGIIVVDKESRFIGFS